jgi:hypothetical protein
MEGMEKLGQAKRRKRGAARVAVRAALWAGRWTVRLVLAALLALAGLFAYLHHVGVPAVFTEMFLDRLAREGYYLQVKRFKLEIDRGLVAEGVRMFEKDDSAVPFLEAEELSVAAEPAALWRRKKFTPVLAVVGGTLRANPGDGSVGDGVRAGDGEVQIRDINLRFTANSNELLLREFAAECLGIRFRGRGAVYFAPEERVAATEERKANPLSQALEALDGLPDGVRRAVEELNALEFAEPPEAEFSFVVYLAHPESNRASLRLRNPEGGTSEGRHFDGCDLALEWEDGVLRFPTVQFRMGGGLAGASGWFDTKNGTVRASVVETIPPAELLELCPGKVREAVEENIGDARFPVRLEWETGPIAAEKALEEFKAKLWLSKATIREIDVEKAELEVERKGGMWSLPAGRVQLGGDGEWATRVAVSNGYFREKDRRFEIRWSGAVNPHHVKAALPADYQEIIDWFQIGEPVAIEGGVTGGTVGDPAVYCYGNGLATNFAVRGEPVQSFKTYVDITNEVMHLTGMVLQRPEGWARGDVHMAFSNQTLRLDVESTIDARAATRMIAPAVSNFFVPFRLEGPARVRVAGLLDYCNFSLNRMEGHIAAQDFGYGRWKADAVDGDFAVRGRRVSASNVTAEAYGGHAEGNMRLYSLGRDDLWRYEVQLDSVKAVQIDRLLEASIGHPVEKLKGDLYGKVQIAGMIGEGQGRTVTGSGRAEIRNGFLMESKLFAGLSFLLGKLLPDFSAFAQTAAGGDFSIRNSRIHSKDIRLEGTVFSVKAEGSFGFDNTLDYVAEVQLLRGGMVASLVRLATMPVTRLLEFRLGGTLSDPTWKPENLTLDVFKKLVGGGEGGENGEGESGSDGEAHPG